MNANCLYFESGILSKHDIIVQGVSFEIFWFQMAAERKLCISDPKLVKPKCIWGVAVFFKSQLFFHGCEIKRRKMASICIKLHGLMDKAVDCYAKGPQIESYSGDIRKIYFWRNLLFFKFFFEKITFSIKNCHPSNTFWLY